MNGTPPATHAVHATALTKQFGRRVAVGGVSLALDAGSCLALFGPNGAGKTTLLRLVAGLLKPSSGTVRVRGDDARRNARARGAVGLISHQSMLYAPLTALENVVFAARLYGMSDPVAAARRALAGMGMLDRAQVPVRTLSRGLQQRVSIARATVHEPAVVLLDEPYSGLDEGGAGALTTLLTGLRTRGATLVLVTHNLAEGLALATHVAIMRDGMFARFESREDAPDTLTYAAEYRRLVGNVA
ncbi:MAG TPA: heme ABC exporter ATP-binding protein CcmA [Gemmatimonadaceae bacterium]|nr:heme ABC exporter ATP-binding protein CcmA [Gemmatimonadaceae bacterium]